jgi:hypothetical protein
MGGDVLRSVECGRHAEHGFLPSRMTNARWDSPMISGMSDDAITTAMPASANSVMMR